MDLLSQTEALESHIRMLTDQNRIIEDELNKFIREDDDLAQRLDNRRSQSPTARRMQKKEAF